MDAPKPKWSNPYSAEVTFVQQIFETLAHRYSSESTQQELSNEYQYDRVYLHPCYLDESSLNIGRVEKIFSEV